MQATKDEPKRVTSWEQEPTRVEVEYLNVEVMEGGGLTTVHFPFNVPGAVETRDHLNLGAAAWLVDHDVYSPKVRGYLNAASNLGGTAPHKPSEAKAFYFQMANTRGGQPNPLARIAPGWTSMFHNGHGGLTAQPKHLCQALASVTSSSGKYDGLAISIINKDGGTEPVTLDQLIVRTSIVMLPPPMPRGSSALSSHDQLALMRTEIATLKRTRDERAADDHITRLCQTTAEALPITAGEWQGDTPGSSASTPARNR